MDRYVIIVAGGSGQRMESKIPKQFLLINKEVILMKSIQAFYTFDPLIKIIVALPSDQIAYWNSLCLAYKFNISHEIVEGGQTRYHSVKNAIQKIGDEGYVAIHDGVRPLILPSNIQTLFQTAKKFTNAVPYIDIQDSIRKIELDGNKSVNRNSYKLIQTPQVFACSLIKEAYMHEWKETFTDDASIVEQLGVKIKLVQGNRENIKITTAIDLFIAEKLSNYLSE